MDKDNDYLHLQLFRVNLSMSIVAQDVFFTTYKAEKLHTQADPFPNKEFETEIFIIIADSMVHLFRTLNPEKKLWLLDIFLVFYRVNTIKPTQYCLGMIY